MLRANNLFIVGLLSVMLGAGTAIAGDLTIENAKARVIVPTNPAAAYFTVKNAGDADQLTAVSSPAFARAELHTHKMDDGVARMLKVEAIEIPANGEAALKTGGDHVMLFEAVKPLKVGDSFPLTLTFEKAGAMEITVVVAPLKDTMPHGGHGDHGKGHSTKGAPKMKHGDHHMGGHGHH